MSERVVLLEWYLCRDTLFGRNFVKQNIVAGLKLAEKCLHPDAVWMTRAVSGRRITTAAEFKNVMLEQAHNNDARALCFAIFNWGDQNDVEYLQQSANMGYAMAQVLLARTKIGQERFVLELSAASQGEREGFFALGYWYNEHVQFDEAKHNYLIAAELGHVSSMVHYARLLDGMDTQKYYWAGKAAAAGCSSYFLDNFEGWLQLKSFPITFAIGRAARNDICLAQRRIFNCSNHSQRAMTAIMGAVDVFIVQCHAARKAVDVCTLCVMRLGIYKDMRRYIAEFIWNARDLVQYE